MYSPWLPAQYTDKDVIAIQAVANGTATPEQQIHALKYIVNDIARYMDLSFRPDNERATTFAEGKRFVGLQIAKLTKLNLGSLRKSDE